MHKLQNYTEAYCGSVVSGTQSTAPMELRSEECHAWQSGSQYCAQPSTVEAEYVMTNPKESLVLEPCDKAGKTLVVGFQDTKQSKPEKQTRKTPQSYYNLNSKYAEQREYVENNKREITCHNKDKLTTTMARLFS